MELNKALELLLVPFPDSEIDKLPKVLSREDKDKGACVKGSRYSADGNFCGGFHARALHLDYVGHSALTARLLQADPEWTWEPVAFGEDGLPRFDNNGGLWIRLTVGGVTRLGYGDAQGKQGPNAVKEAIGDGLRNAAMRFGAALDLWRKGDRKDAETARGVQPAPQSAVPDEIVHEWVDALTDADTLTALARLWAEAGKQGVTRDPRVIKAKDTRKVVLNKLEDQ